MRHYPSSLGCNRTKLAQAMKENHVVSNSPINSAHIASFMSSNSKIKKVYFGHPQSRFIPVWFGMVSSEGGIFGVQYHAFKRWHGGFRQKAACCIQRTAKYCRRAEGSKMFSVGERGGGGLRKVGGGLEATAFVSMLASSVSSRVLWLSCNMLWNV